MTLNLNNLAPPQQGIVKPQHAKPESAANAVLEQGDVTPTKNGVEDWGLASEPGKPNQGAVAIWGLVSVLLEVSLLFATLLNAVWVAEVGSLDVVAFFTTLSFSITAMKELYGRDTNRMKLVAASYLLDMALSLVFCVGIVMAIPLFADKTVVAVALFIAGLLNVPYISFCVFDFFGTLENSMRGDSRTAGDDDGSVLTDRVSDVRSLLSRALGERGDYRGSR